jgi:hypothetical protein
MSVKTGGSGVSSVILSEARDLAIITVVYRKILHITGDDATNSRGVVLTGHAGDLWFK